MTKPLRVGVVGVGVMGRHHVRAVLERDDVTLAAVVDHGQHGAEFADVAHVAVDLEPALAVGLDCCIVAVPTNQHEVVAVALAEAGIPTLVEKPLADTSASAERIRQAFHDAGVPGGVGHIERSNAAAMTLRALLAQDELGDLWQVESRRQSPFPERVRDVGVVADLAIHDFDLAAWLARSHYESIVARTRHRFGQLVEDQAVCLGALANGVLTSHVATWLSPTRERRTTVVGERGILVADTLNTELWRCIKRVDGGAEDRRARADDDWELVPHAESKDALNVQLDRFVALVRGIEDAAAGLASFDAGVGAVAVAEAALRSAESSHIATPGR
ncbi:MAG TPA: Gfo/Idh/MocA family oxidoreductase [Acidimicrobiia bacterium]